jgi:hypothetical protein
MPSQERANMDYNSKAQLEQIENEASRKLIEGVFKKKDGL